MSSRLDAALRKLVEAGVPLEDLNPEVLSQDYRDPRFANRPMKPESKPYMGPWGGWLDAVVEKAASAAGWLDERSPQGAALTPTNPLYGGRAKAETAVRMMQPLRGRDFGATGVHEGDMYPGVPKAAGMVVGPAIKIAPDVIKAIKRLVRGGDEVVDFVKQADQLKLPRTTRTKKKKPEPEKPREKTIDKLSRKARQEEALESQGELISRSPKYELEVRELSQKQYDDLIDDGWKHQEILDEHPVIPYSVRREGREILGLEPPSSSFQSRTSTPPKTARKPFDEYTRDRSPESYINPGDTELQKEFAEIASAQRGAPEKIMLKITSIDKGMGEKEYTFISEHIGDLYNRMTQPINMTSSFNVITDKFKKLKLNLSPKSNAALPRYVKRIKEEMPEVVELLDEFADAHAAVDISTSMGVAKPVQLARDAAVAYGKLDLDEAVRLLKELEPYMEDYDLFKKAMFNFGL